nr:MAG TPA: hypothetical protein [Caudoviricetes sp.]
MESVRIGLDRSEAAKTVYSIYSCTVTANVEEGDHYTETEKGSAYDNLIDSYETLEEASEKAAEYAKDDASYNNEATAEGFVFNRYVVSRDFLDEDGCFIDGDEIGNYNGISSATLCRAKIYDKSEWCDIATLKNLREAVDHLDDEAFYAITAVYGCKITRDEVTVPALGFKAASNDDLVKLLDFYDEEEINTANNWDEAVNMLTDREVIDFLWERNEGIVEAAKKAAK